MSKNMKTTDNFLLTGSTKKTCATWVRKAGTEANEQIANEFWDRSNHLLMTAFALSNLTHRSSRFIGSSIQSRCALNLPQAILALPPGIEFVSPPSVIPALPTLVLSVKEFDGSSITDTIVVSNSFWSELSSKLPALIVAQVAAAVLFVTILTIFAVQGNFLSQVTSDSASDSRVKRFKKANALPSIDLAKLSLCILIDIVGSSNEAIPLIGEIVDVVYAPMAALLLRQLFQGSNIVFLLEFAEEILPFTDILPLATICWVVETYFGEGIVARSLGIGGFAPAKSTETRNVLGKDESSVRSIGPTRANLEERVRASDSDQ